jgi:uncharacterized protein (TIGR02996 family)
MSDEDGLLAAIWAEPHDDTPRLVYADWLDENGQSPRAEFIRVQIELARRDPWDDHAVELTAREGALSDLHAAEWKAKLPQRWHSSPFHRGFLRLDLSKLPFERLIQLTPRQLRFAPLSRYHYNLEGDHIDPFLQWPGAAVQDLFAPRPPAQDGWVERVAACKLLRNVSEIAVISGLRHVMQAAQVRMLLDTWADRPLRTFDLREGVRVRTPAGADDATYATIAYHPVGAKLRRLALRNGRPSTLALRELVCSPHLENVRMFDLQGTWIGDAGTLELTQSPLLTHVWQLSLAATQLGDEGVISLANSPAVANLRLLNLYDNRIGVEGLRALARSAYLGNVQFLSLLGNPGCDDRQVGGELRARFGHIAHFRL